MTHSSLSLVDQDTNASIETKEQPHNIEAEQAILGSLLLKNDLIETIGEILKPDYFYHLAHQKIYAAICQLIDRGQIANPVILKNYFASEDILSEVGGHEYITQLTNQTVSFVNANNYAALLHELYLKRKLIEIGDELTQESFKNDLDYTATNQIENCEKQLFDLATTGDVGQGFEALKDSIGSVIITTEEAIKRDSPMSGVTTGLRDMNTLLGGLQKTDLVILAGRPSMGKTSLATNIATNASKAFALTKGKEGGKVAFFSLEMSAEQLALRILAEESGIQSHKIRKGEITPEEFQKFSLSSEHLKTLPLFTDDTPAISISAVRTRARRLKRVHGLDMIIVDYLQLLRGSAKHYDSRVLEISEITRGLKAIAKELNVPVLALSQLSRAVEQREDKRPQLSDLRESGSIEQDADVVMFVYREQYYHERTMPNPKSDEDSSKYQEKLARWQERSQEIQNISEVIIAKQRHGPIGTVKLHFDANLTKFSDLDLVH